MRVSIARPKSIFKVDRFLIPYRVYENEGPHVICINGVQQSMAMWQTLVSRFQSDYRIVLFDFPGQGKARTLFGPINVSLDEQVQILHAVMDEAGVSSDATMCAASWGGVVAVAFAAKYRDRIKKLLLASLGTRPNKKMAETIKQGAGMDVNDRERMAEILLKSFGDDLPAQIKHKIVAQFRTMKEQEVRAFYEHGLFVISSKRLSDLVDLKKVEAKTFLVNGEKDAIIDSEDVKFLASQIPGCEVRVLKGVGHFLHMEREDVMDAYADILAF